MHVIAAKAVAFGEALAPEFRDYIRQVIDNARTLARVLTEGGVEIVSGGTDSHLMLVDLRPKGLTGKAVELALSRSHITCNKNGIPNDPEKPMITSGIRLGTPAVTTRGMKTEAVEAVGQLILEVIDGLARSGAEGNSDLERSVREKVSHLLRDYPIYYQA